MKNILNNPWVVGGLCILAVITVYFRLFDSKKRPVPSPVVVAKAEAQATDVVPLPTPVVPNPASDSPPSSLSLDDLDFSWPKEFRQDPFRPQSENIAFVSALTQNNVEEGRSPAPPVTLELRAVFVEGPNRVAMINRELVKEGEQVSGYVVDRIQRDGVQLRGKSETRWLEFNASSSQPSSDSSNEDELEASLDKELFAS